MGSNASNPSTSNTNPSNPPSNSSSVQRNAPTYPHYYNSVQQNTSTPYFFLKIDLKQTKMKQTEQDSEISSQLNLQTLMGTPNKLIKLLDIGLFQDQQRIKQQITRRVQINQIRLILAFPPLAELLKDQAKTNPLAIIPAIEPWTELLVIHLLKLIQGLTEPKLLIILSQQFPLIFPQPIFPPTTNKTNNSWRWLLWISTMRLERSAFFLRWLFSKSSNIFLAILANLLTLIACLSVTKEQFSEITSNYQKFELWQELNWKLDRLS